MDQDLIKRIVEAALLAAGQPLTVAQLSSLFPEEQPAPQGAIEKALHALGEEASQRGVELVEVASGFRFQVRHDVQPWVSRLWTERPPRYSRALLETLALIAYRQPITRGEIEQIRGVAVSSNIMRTLEEREWVRVVGHRDVPGKPALYGTTRAFLDYFGLKSLDQLPPLSELREIPDLEPQLALEPVEGAPRQLSAAPADEDVDRDPTGRAEDHEADSDGRDASLDERNAAPGTGGADHDGETGTHAMSDAGIGNDDADAHDHAGETSPDTDLPSVTDDASGDSETADRPADDAGRHSRGADDSAPESGTSADGDAAADNPPDGPTGTVRPEQTA